MTSSGKAAENSRSSMLLAGVLLVVAATIVSGYVSGKLNRRWGEPVEALRGAQLVEDMPEVFGSWRFQGRQELSKDALDQLDCYGYENGAYLNIETGDVVQVSLIVGPYGPMSVHSPDICYPASGYTRTAARRREKITPGDSGEGGEFWVTSFQPRELGALPLRVFYAWYAHDVWQAPSNPRIAIGGDPAVFKLQVALQYDPLEEDKADREDPCVGFIKAFLSVWERELAASGAAVSDGPRGK